MTRLAELRNGGLTIGLSVSGPKQGETIARALEIEFDGQLLFGAVQATWNLLEQAAGPVLQRANDKGLMVIVKEAVANGRLTSRNVAPDFAPKMTQLNALADELNTSIDALAISAAIHQPWSSIVLSGAAQTDHLLSNLRAVDLAMNAAILKRCESIRETSESYWRIRSQLAWN